MSFMLFTTRENTAFDVHSVNKKINLTLKKSNFLFLFCLKIAMI